MITKANYLPKIYRDVVNETIQRNAFFAHPENITIGMLCDSRLNVRQAAVHRILESRLTSTATTIRVFKIPEINFEADDYTNLINWDKINFSEPPLIRGISNDVLNKIGAGSIDLKNIQHFQMPCHSQAVERAVKVMSTYLFNHLLIAVKNSILF